MARYISTIIVHHSASPPDTTIDQIREWHLERGFSDVGYHFVVNIEGVFVGRPLDRMGAHCKGNNSHSIGICICGDYRPGHDVMSGQMWRWAVELAADLCESHGIKWGDVYGHNELSPTACPGFEPAQFRTSVGSVIVQRGYPQ